MEQKTLYTAIGRLERETNGCGRSCPVIRLGGQPRIFLFSAISWPHLWAVLSAGHGMTA